MSVIELIEVDDAGPLMEDGEAELARLFLSLLARGEHDFPEAGI